MVSDTRVPAILYKTPQCFMHTTRPVTLHVLFDMKLYISELHNFAHREVYQTERKFRGCTCFCLQVKSWRRNYCVGSNRQSN